MLVVLAGLYRVGDGTMTVEAFLVLAAAVEIWWTVVLAGLFHKADVPFLFAAVPVLRFWMLARIGFGFGMAALPWLVPAVNVFWFLRFDRSLAARYGMSRFFGTCMFFLPFVFYTWLAFGRSCTYMGFDRGEGRVRDRQGYEGGGYVEGLYDDDAAEARKSAARDAEKEELRRRLEARRNR